MGDIYSALAGDLLGMTVLTLTVMMQLRLSTTLRQKLSPISLM
jgi:hypothetical protein